MRCALLLTTALLATPVMAEDVIHEDFFGGGGTICASIDDLKSYIKFIELGNPPDKPEMVASCQTLRVSMHMKVEKMEDYVFADTKYLIVRYTFRGSSIPIQYGVLQFTELITS
jgi:hypothetical protein